MQRKYIRISRQNERRSVSAGRTYSCPAAAMEQAAPAGDRNPDAERLWSGKRESGRLSGRTNSWRTGRGARRTGTASAGRRGTSLVIHTLVLAVIFSGMLAGFQMMTRASSPEKEQTYKYYTTVTIGYGEDLSDIVYQYCDSREYESADAYVREICDINSLPYHKGSVPDLKAGAKIVIPYYSTELK